MQQDHASAADDALAVWQAATVQERFQAAVTHFQGALTVTNLVKLWEQALQ